MPEIQIVPSAPIQPAAHAAWMQPELRQLDAADAENGFRIGFDGGISTS